MMRLLATWQFWVVLSACFAALTAIFAKVGVENVGADFATFIRTVVILCVLAAIITATGEWQTLEGISARSILFLVFSGCATRSSNIWLLIAPQPTNDMIDRTLNPRQVSTGRAAYSV
jgi:bacterial/archaeal transporter family protein